MKVSVLSIMLIAVLIMGCSTKNQEQKTTVVQTPHTFYYYPKTNIYFDTTAGNYIYLSSDGKTWQPTTHLTSGQKGALGKNVIIKNAIMPVWKDNEMHRIIYAAALYATPADLSAEPAKPGRTYNKEKGVDNEEAILKEEIRKSGIGRFFQRIFNKKEKDKKHKNRG